MMREPWDDYVIGNSKLFKTAELGCADLGAAELPTPTNDWKPEGRIAAGLFERLHDEFGGDAWLVGRVTGQEFAKGNAYSASVSEGFGPAARVKPLDLSRMGSAASSANMASLRS
jgi:hypothetical protein